MSRTTVIKYLREMKVMRYSILKDELIVLNPFDKPEAMTWPLWQLVVKKSCCENQEWRCPCGMSLLGGMQLHHALLTRRDVMKMRENWRIHNTLNCICVCSACQIHPTRAVGAKYLVELYGEGPVRQWYDEFPMKSDKIKFDYFLNNENYFC